MSLVPFPPLTTEPARHGNGGFTAILSDLHISDADPPDPRRPGWRAYKRAGLTNDARIAALLDHLRSLSAGAPIELVFNGDTFDFDTIIAVPDPAPFPVSWLERKRGLASEEPKSLWKLERILAFHPDLVATLRQWLDDGHALVFIIGNHDLDLHWPSVQKRLFEAIMPGGSDRLTLCEWFRVCGGDTLVIHGNQLDAYCVCQDPLHPFIDVAGSVRVRSPFGNTAGKLMLNGMGYFNPHVESSFIRPLGEYIRFFFRYIVRHQPMLAGSWLWSAVVTLWVSLSEGFHRAVDDPERLGARIDDVARRAGALPHVAIALRQVAVHSAVFSPLRVVRELWLDRAFLLFGLVAVAFWSMLALHWVSGAHTWTAAAFFFGLLPFYIAYARSCRSEVAGTEEELQGRVGQLSRIAGVKRVVVGHTHRFSARDVDGVTYLNTGHWSPAFDDVECTQPVGCNGFAWIAPGGGGVRTGELRMWQGGASTAVPIERLSSSEGMPEITARTG